MPLAAQKLFGIADLDKSRSAYAEQSVELEAENWRLSSTTLVRGAICRAGS